MNDSEEKALSVREMSDELSFNFDEEIINEIKEEFEFKKLRIQLKDREDWNPFSRKRMKEQFEVGDLPKQCKLRKPVYLEIFRLLLTGAHESVVCRMVGISKDTYDNWYEKGSLHQEQIDYGDRDKDTVFSRFYEMVNYASSAPESRLINLVYSAAERDTTGRLALEILRGRYKGWSQPKDVNIKAETKTTSVSVEITEINDARKSSLDSILSSVTNRTIESSIEDGEIRELPETNPLSEDGI